MIFSFSLLLALVSFFFLLFPKKCPIFPQIRGFFGGVVGKGLFCLCFRSTFAASKKQDNAELFSALENLFV